MLFPPTLHIRSLRRPSLHVLREDWEIVSEQRDPVRDLADVTVRLVVAILKAARVIRTSSRQLGTVQEALHAMRGSVQIKRVLGAHCHVDLALQLWTKRRPVARQ